MIPIPPSLASIGIPNIPECHAVMYAEWVKRGKPRMEVQTSSGAWINLLGEEPAWCSEVRYRFKEESPLNNQVGGDHYSKMKIQPAKYIHANEIGFIEGSVIKYISRWRDKGGIQDLEKAKHFIDLLIELEYGNG